LFPLLALVMMLQLHGCTAAHVAQLHDIIPMDESGCSSLVM
jgi:hypothetical protein